MRLGFRHFLAGSPRQQAESSLRRLTEISLYCGLDVRLRLLPTPPHGDAVTISYEEPDIPRQGLPPRQCNNITGALGQAFQPDVFSPISINMGKQSQAGKPYLRT